MAPPAEHHIGIRMETQEGRRTCWAAIAVSIANFRRPPGVPPMRQCELARLHLPGDRPCCDAPLLNGPCDDESALELALGRAGVANTPIPGRLEFVDLQPLIAANRPVCCSIRWTTTGKFHFVQIDGYIADGPRGDEVFVNDPKYQGANGGRIAYTDLVNRYRTVGQWFSTYTIL